MESARAQQVATAYLRAAGGQGWFDRVQAASEAFLPDTDDWAIYSDPDRRGIEALIFATDGEALYRLELVEIDRVVDVEVRRIVLADARPRVEVTERRAQDVDRATLRQRTWAFVFEGADEIRFRTEEPLLGTGEEPEPLELFARTLARATGWPVAD